MSSPAAIRPSGIQAVTDFLASATVEPSALVLEGEPGIGKTTLWSAAKQQACSQEFVVLSARAAETEPVMSYAALADLLSEVDESVLARLLKPQRIALDRILLRTNTGSTSTDQRAVAAAFLAVIIQLAERSPVLLAVDDLQWLDPSSAHVIAFAARRLSGPVGLLGTVRTDATGKVDAGWLQLPRPESITRITLGALSLGGLHALLTQRWARPFSRPTVVRIRDISGGNPLYALELARVIDHQPASDPVPLPATLAELVRTRIGRLDRNVHDVLLAVACLSEPTVDLVARATGSDAGHVLELLADAEDNGIVEFEGHRLRFTHPLLARGVYTDATPARRQAMHRRLADVVSQSELKARHLALAATGPDSHTLRSLDLAADSARTQGAPAAAAELVDLAISLGGGTPERQILSARNHFDAGDTGRARALLHAVTAELGPCPLRAEALSHLAVVHLADDSFHEAIACFEHALEDVSDNLQLHVQILATLSWVLLQSGQLDAAVDCVQDAVIHAEHLAEPHLLSQVLSFRTVLRFMRGEGLDELSLGRAVDLDDGHAYSLITVHPRMQRALLLSWTGQLDAAHREMAWMYTRCIEQGGESELIFISFHSMLLDIWRGDFSEADRSARDMVERAMQLDGNISRAVGLMMRSAIAGYGGHLDEARRDAAEALAAGQQSGAVLVVMWQLMFMGFFEISAGNHQAALDALTPLLAVLDTAPDRTEIVSAAYLPDAVEAMIGLGQFAEAERLIALLERNGRRLNRTWMLAVGARGRAMLLGATGDLEAATSAAQRAMMEHERLPMPFERARSQLLLGQLLLQQRRKQAAATALTEALGIFDTLGIPLWAQRARSELARIDLPVTAGAALSTTEQRVAEFAASGMTNRRVAAALYISPKTVEAHLARVYRKLGIRSRAELGRHVNLRDQKTGGLQNAEAPAPNIGKHPIRRTGPRP